MAEKVNLTGDDENMRYWSTCRQGVIGFSLRRFVVSRIKVLNLEWSFCFFRMTIEHDFSGNVVLDRQTSQVKPPPMYQVILLNDDYTPMEFVVLVLQKYFSKTELEATRIMLRVHHDGRGVCGVYTKDIAATRTAQVVQLARAYQHPLQCVMEPVEE